MRQKWILLSQLEERVCVEQGGEGGKEEGEGAGGGEGGKGEGG